MPVSMLRLFQQQSFRKVFALSLLFLFIPGFSAIAIAEAFSKEKFRLVNSCILFETVEVELQPFPNLDKVF